MMPDRPSVPEIEITPEMSEAGAEAIGVFDGGYFETRAQGAERVYRVMHAAKVAGLASALKVLDDSI